MQRCTTCGKTENLRLYILAGGSHLQRRWWCPACWFSARRLGVNAELAPVWIERAALNQLPTKSLVTGYPSAPAQPFTRDARNDPPAADATPTHPASAVASARG